MRFTSTSTIPFPREEVFRTYRDRLPEVVAFMDDIESVTVQDRREDGARVILHNEWSSAREVPKVAQGFLKPDQMKWDDYATWDEASFLCHFDIRTRAFRDAVSCKGTNTFRDLGDKTEVVLDGDFEVDLKSIPGVPRLLAGRIAPQIEKFIIGLIQPNLETTNQAVSRFLSAQES